MTSLRNPFQGKQWHFYFQEAFKYEHLFRGQVKFEILTSESELHFFELSGQTVLTKKILEHVYKLLQTKRCS